jgi:hypothetical protein
LKRRLAERTDFVGVVFDKNSMNVSTCFCAPTGKVSYLAIKVSLLITESSYPQMAKAAICLLKRVTRPRIKDGGQHHFIFQRRAGVGDATGSSVCNGSGTMLPQTTI